MHRQKVFVDLQYAFQNENEIQNVIGGINVCYYSVRVGEHFVNV